MKYKIFYIDDQSFALPQLIRSIPDYIDYELIYVQRVKDIQEEGYFLIVLDFYLDKDNKTALDIIDKFSGANILSFSTCSQKNELMLTKGACYGVKKLKGTNENKELNRVMKVIFG